jgi:CRISPR/Cas system-associated exonuclease Cas4 (RecB family)
MSSLPQGFQFSQRSLQDYVDCQRRFQLRYIENLAWPAVESEPLSEREGLIQAGAAFHRLVQHYLAGIPPERLSEIVHSSDAVSSDLQHWWDNFLQYSGILPVEEQLVETSLSAPLQNYRLLAKYDLIRWEVEGDNLRVKIFDWKTSKAKPSRRWLQQRLQTRVYPYLLAQAGFSLVGIERIKPEQIEMVYWFAEHPHEQQVFAFNEERFQADGEYLLAMVQEIDTLGDSDFHLTVDEERCRFCSYRSLCDRGVSAGVLVPDELVDDPDAGKDFELDFEQIAEIEF